MRTCSVAGCSSKHLARGLCSRHYNREYAHGSTDLPSSNYSEWPHHLREWKTLDQFPGYRFCSDGSVWTSWQPAGVGKGMKMGDHWRRLLPSLKAGYPTVLLTPRTGPKKSRTVHSLVALAFLGERPAGMQCCHNDGDRTNNSVTNLRYDTSSGNQRDRYRHGTMVLGVANNKAKLTPEAVRRIRALKGTKSLAKIGEEFGVTAQAVQQIHLGKTWAHVSA